MVGTLTLCPPCDPHVVSDRRLARELFRREPPARAGYFLRREVDVLFKPHQLPVAGRGREGKAGFASERDHDVVGTERVAEQTPGAKSSGAALQIAEQRRADAVALPAIVDGEAELEALGIGIEAIAGLAGDGLKPAAHNGRDHAETVVLAGMDEMI